VLLQVTPRPRSLHDSLKRNHIQLTELDRWESPFRIVERHIIIRSRVPLTAK